MGPILERALKKARSSRCREKVSAVGFDWKGKILGYSRNIPRFVRKGGSIHAEMALMARYGKNIKSIIICRTNKSGDLLAIHPCKTCQRKADELGIKIMTVFEGLR